MEQKDASQATMFDGHYKDSEQKRGKLIKTSMQLLIKKRDIWSNIYLFGYVTLTFLLLISMQTRKNDPLMRKHNLFRKTRRMELLQIDVENIQPLKALHRPSGIFQTDKSYQINNPITEQITNL